MSSAQRNNNGSRDGAPFSPVTSLPLSEEDTVAGGEPSLGTLVRDATVHLSELFRAELELARAEITSEVRKGVRGSVYFILAVAVLSFSLFFLFFALAEGLAQLGLWRWAAFGIVFLAMLVTAALLGLLGYRRVRKIRAPKRTIESLRDTARITRRHGQIHAD